jgi:hemerythrin superfamily protein
MQQKHESARSRRPILLARIMNGASAAGFSYWTSARNETMKATDLLKAQHKVVKKLFAQIEEAKDEDQKAELFQELAQNLVAHDGIEREIFYPACEEKMGMTDLLGEAMVEHGVIEFSLHLADEAIGDDDFDHKVTVLSEMVEHHVEEEEGEFFPKVEKALGAARLEELGATMEARFEEAKAADFHPPLHQNLRLVLDGVTEAAGKRAKKSGAKARKNGAKKAHPHAAEKHG